MLSAYDIHKAFAGQHEVLQVLQGFSLEVRPGEIVAIIGPSGCGKSTFIRLCAGIDQVDSGRICVQRDEHAVADISIALQDHGLLDWLTVRENILLASRLQHIQQQGQSVDELVQKVGLGGFADAYPDQLSGGMKSRAALARALLVPSAVLLLDEPFRSLDEVTARRVSIDTGKLLRQRKQTTLLITHSIAEAVRLADRVVMVSYRPMSVTKIFPIDLPEAERISLVSEVQDKIIRTIQLELSKLQI